VLLFLCRVSEDKTGWKELDFITGEWQLSNMITIRDNDPSKTRM
jgi:hypothetical protein